MWDCEVQVIPLLVAEGLDEVCCRPLRPIYRGGNAADDFLSRWPRPTVITGAAFALIAAYDLIDDGKFRELNVDGQTLNNVI